MLNTLFLFKFTTTRPLSPPTRPCKLSRKLPSSPVDALLELRLPVQKTAEPCRGKNRQTRNQSIPPSRSCPGAPRSRAQPAPCGEAARENHLRVVRDTHSRVENRSRRQPWDAPDARTKVRSLLPSTRSFARKHIRQLGEALLAWKLECLASQCSISCLLFEVTMKVCRQLWQTYALASFACFAKLSLLVADFTPAASFLSFSFFLS